MDTMGIMSAALGFDCSECHTGAGTDTVKWEADTPKKRTARTNDADGGGDQSQQLRGTPGRDLLDLSSRPRHSRHHCRQSIRCTARHSSRLTTSSRSRFLESPRLTRFSTNTCRRSAASNAWRASPVSSRRARARASADLEAAARFKSSRKRPISAPRSSSLRKTSGGRTPFATFDGRNGWVSAPLSVVPEYALGGSELDGARIDAQLSFPAQIKKSPQPASRRPARQHRRS